MGLTDAASASPTHRRESRPSPGQRNVPENEGRLFFADNEKGAAGAARTPSKCNWRGGTPTLS